MWNFDEFQSDSDLEQRRQDPTGASTGFAALMVCLTHTTQRIQGGDVMSLTVVAPLIAMSHFRLELHHGKDVWSCLLCKASGRIYIGIQWKRSQEKIRCESELSFYRCCTFDVTTSCSLERFQCFQMLWKVEIPLCKMNLETGKSTDEKYFYGRDEKKSTSNYGTQFILVTNYVEY